MSQIQDALHFSILVFRAGIYGRGGTEIRGRMGSYMTTVRDIVITASLDRLRRYNKTTIPEVHLR
jgi:hypothetical protein